MRYVGGKYRFSKIICEYLLPYVGLVYIEPFVGSGAVLVNVPNIKRIANDSHPYLISLLTAVSYGWLPPIVVSESLYKSCRDNPEQHAPELVGFVGFACSFAAKWFGGFARGGTRNYALEGYKNLAAQAPLLKGVSFFCGSYLELDIPESPSLIYCDPPYRNTQGYGEPFDSDVFWEWCRVLSTNGHILFISEYSAPSDIPCIWEKTRAASLDRNTGGKISTEKLFYMGPL